MKEYEDMEMRTPGSNPRAATPEQWAAYVASRLAMVEAMEDERFIRSSVATRYLDGADVYSTSVYLVGPNQVMGGD